MLHNRNMQISILEINRKRIITLLNTLSHLSENRHLTSRYLHKVVKLLNVVEA